MTQDLINKYIEDHKLSWAPSTLKSERARLQSISQYLVPQNAEKMWNVMVQEHNLKPYARVTTWTRICNFIDWCLINNHIIGTNEYELFKTKNRRLFKNCYQRRLPSITYSQALESIESISNSDVRTTAQQILKSGMRASEALSNNGKIVVGKGNKPRKVYGTDKASTGVTYARLYSTIKKECNLTPHMLRKIMLSRLVELGANPFELCKVAGWSSLETARSYINVDDSKIKKLMDKMHEKD